MELVALIPLLAILVVMGWQVAVAGQSVWLVATAARSAARAQALGEDPEDAARAAVPRGLRGGLRVHDDKDGVAVRIAIPTVVGGTHLGSVTSRASFPKQAQ